MNNIKGLNESCLNSINMEINFLQKNLSIPYIGDYFFLGWGYFSGKSTKTYLEPYILITTVKSITPPSPLPI